MITFSAIRLIAHTRSSAQFVQGNRAYKPCRLDIEVADIREFERHQLFFAPLLGSTMSAENCRAGVIHYAKHPTPEERVQSVLNTAPLQDGVSIGGAWSYAGGPEK